MAHSHDVLGNDAIATMNLPSLRALEHASPSDLARVCLFALRVAIARVFFELVVSSHDRWERWLCRHHLSLATRLHDDESVISFNYDLVCDNAIWEAVGGRDAPGWTDDLQGAMYGWVDGGGDSIRPVPRPRLLKPHGSANWMGLCSPLHTGEQWHGMICSAPDIWLGHFGNEQPNLATGWEPVIALPHEAPFALGSDQSNRLGCLRHPFRFLLQECLDAIDRAAACVAIGYSFRDDHDTVGRVLVERLIDRAIPIFIVGDPKLPERLRGRGIADVHWVTESIGAFAATFRTT